MKALPSIAFSGFRGTASEVTARQTGGRTVLSGRAQHSHVKTPKQSLRRASFAYISRLYRTLSREQLSAWASLAAAHREAALIGDGAPLTGHNLFVCLNTNRSILGVPVTKDAPDTVHGSSYVAFDDIWITPGRLLIAGLKDPDSPESRLVVKMAATDSAAVTKAWGKTVITGTFDTTDWGDIDLTEIYTERFGIPVTAGHKYFIEMYWIDSGSGYVSEVTRVCHIASESLSIHGREYVPRQRITQDDLTDDGRNSVSELDIEFTSGSPVLAASGILEGYEGIAASYAYFRPETAIPYEGVEMTAYVLTRSTGSLGPQVFAVYIYKGVPHRQDGITFAHRSGKYSKPSEMTGGALLLG